MCILIVLLIKKAVLRLEIIVKYLVGSVESIIIGSCVIISNKKEMFKNRFYGDVRRWTHSNHTPVVIWDNVWIGGKTTFLKGVTIGEGSVIGCNSVVTKDISPYSV